MTVRSPSSRMSSTNTVPPRLIEASLKIQPIMYRSGARAAAQGSVGMALQPPEMISVKKSGERVNASRVGAMLITSLGIRCVQVRDNQEGRTGKGCEPVQSFRRSCDPPKRAVLGRLTEI